MSINPYVRKYFFNQAILPDDKGCAFNAHAELAVQRFFVVDAVRGRYRPIGVGKQRHVQIIPLAEPGLLFRTIRADSYRNCLFLFNLRPGITEPGCFAGSSRCVRLWIEKEHDRLFACIITQPLNIAVIVLDRKIRRFAPFVQHGILLSIQPIHNLRNYSCAAGKLPDSVALKPMVRSKGSHVRSTRLTWIRQIEGRLHNPGSDHKIFVIIRFVLTDTILDGLFSLTGSPCLYAQLKVIDGTGL
jgi:hypothetical protein